MKRILLPALALFVAAAALAADTNTTSKVKDALDKLNTASNYSWTATVKIADANFDPGPVKGRAAKGSYAVVSQSFNDNSIDVVFKGDKAAVKTDDGWQSIDEATGMQAMMGGFLTNSGTAADEATKLLKYSAAIKPGDDGLYSSDLTSDGATELLTFRPRGMDAPPAPKNAKGTVKFWLKDGALAKFESHLQGTVSFGPDLDVRDFDITRTVEIQDVGTTKVDAPEEATKKLEKK